MEETSRNSELWLIRHGETTWSRSGQHTSRTDLPLTNVGESQARALLRQLDGIKFTSVFASPMVRAQMTCRLAGLGGKMSVEPRLREWDYGIYEGKTTKEIQETVPGWSIWNAVITDGESLDQVAARTDSLISSLLTLRGRIALFAHAHIFRILAARWIGSPPLLAQHLSLTTASISVLGFERDQQNILRWNCSSQAD